MQKKVAQIWYIDNQGVEHPYSNKFYSKIGVAENLAKKRAIYSSYAYFVRVYNLEFVGDIK